MKNEHIALLISATCLLLDLHVGVAVALAFVAGALFFAAIEKRDP
jgi:hypothetical protein